METDLRGWDLRVSFKLFLTSSLILFHIISKSALSTPIGCLWVEEYLLISSAIFTFVGMFSCPSLKVCHVSNGGGFWSIEDSSLANLSVRIVIARLLLLTSSSSCWDINSILPMSLAISFPCFLITLVSLLTSFSGWAKLIVWRSLEAFSLLEEMLLGVVG